jgi:predicted RNA binding protein YcfA (HicA-like mRNA interferase family)
VSSRLPRVTGRDVLRALRRVGWYEHHQEGSHIFLRHPDHPGMRVTVAVHAGETFKLKTLQSILDQAGLTVEEFRELL